MTAAPLWIFGYGSLIWRPDLPFEEAHPAYIEGWARRFWQGSTDHRGVPGAPGRVVTLVPEAGGRVVGRVFRISDEARASVLARLDHREKGGYERAELTTFGWPTGTHLSNALTYMATPTNPEWLGPAPLEDIAACVGSRVGPSGANREYLLRLASALQELNAPDPHVEGIARIVSLSPGD